MSAIHIRTPRKLYPLRVLLCALLVFSLAFALYTPSPAFAASWSTSLVSHTPGVVSNGATGDSEYPQTTSDGTKIVFMSTARDLTDNDPGNNSYQVYLYDTTTGKTKLISHEVGDPDAGANRDSTAPRITPDGKKIVFMSTARDLTAVDPGNGNMQIYLYDTTTGETTLISHESTDHDTGADGYSIAPQITPDGSKIVYFSDATNLTGIHPGNTKRQIYLHTIASDTTKLISHKDGDSDAGANKDSFEPQMTPDGLKIVYYSEATDLNDSNTIGVPVQVYLYTVAGDTTKLISYENGKPDTGSDGVSGLPQITPDGKKIVYVSAATNLTDTHQSGFGLQVYLYDAAAGGTTKLISHANGNPATEANGSSYYPQITPDGKRVVYESRSTDLTDTSQSGSIFQVYLYTVDGDTTKLISHADGTDATGANSASRYPQITPDGKKIVYESEATNLIDSYNGNGNKQIYLYALDAATLPKTSVNIAQGEQFRDKELAFSYAAPNDVAKTFYRIEGAGSLVPSMTNCAPGAKINIGTNANWPDGNYILRYFSVDRDGDTEDSKSVSFSIKGTDPGTDPGTNPGTDPGASIKISSIKASQKTIYVVKGKKAKLPYIVNASVAGKVSVSWTASKKAVASVGSIKKASGTINPTTNKNQNLTIKTGKKLGTSKITLTSGGKKLVLKVKVVKRAKAVAKSSIKIKNLPKKNVLKVGKSKTLKATFTKKATAIATWKSSKPKVVKIDASGKITALKKGKATITLKAGGRTKKVTIRVK